MKFRLTALITVMLLIFTVIFTGCSSSRTTASGSTGQSIVSNSVKDSRLTVKEAKTVTDTELIDSAKDDPAVQLDLPDNEAQAFSSDDLETLLDDNSVLKDIPERVSTK